jgi:carboxyl-terminal processing protease
VLGSKKGLFISAGVLLLGLLLMVFRAGVLFSSKVKTAEQYWAATGLTSISLEKLIEDQKCSSSERYYLACVNAISSMASRFNLVLTKRGELVSESQRFNLIGGSERAQLEPWRQFYLESPREASQIAFLKLWRTIETEYLKKNQKELIIGVGLNGFISVYQDPHTYIIPVDQFNEVISRADNRSSSLGLQLGNLNGSYVVKKLTPGSPAEKAGIRRGDVLLSVNGRTVESLTLFRVSEKLKGDVGDLTKILVQRDDQRISFELRRAEITVATVSTRLIEGIKRLGIISINKFAKGACDKVKVSLETLKKAQVRGLLLDLRDNPGGQLEEASCVASLFVGPDNKIFEIRYLDASRTPEVYLGEEERIYDGPLAVLINSYSASAAEIVAGALQDLQRAIIVGETSFGKGSFQEGNFWSDNKKLALFETKGFFYLPSGRSPQLVGLNPDVPVKMDNFGSHRESEQYMNPMKAPEMSSFAYVSSFSASKCLEYEGNKSEDLQIEKAMQILFCAQKTARAGL